MKKAINIVWFAPQGNDLPNEVIIPDSVCDEEIHEYLYEEFSYRVYGGIVTGQESE